MAKFIASSGTVAFVGSDISSMCVQDITVNISCETDSLRCMGDGGWETSLPTTKSWEASFNTALDSVHGIDLANTIGVSASLTLDTVGGLGYTGTAICTKADVSAPVDKIATVSWSFKGTGALQES